MKMLSFPGEVHLKKNKGISPLKTGGIPFLH